MAEMLSRPSPGLPPHWERLAAGTYNFASRYNAAAVRIVALSAQTWSMLKDCDDTDHAAGAVYEGFTHDSAGVSEITTDGPIMVYY